MADGTLSAAEIATGALLTGGNRGYGGGGAWGGGSYGAPFADFGTNAVRTNRNEGVIRDSARCTDAQMGATLDRISAQNFEGRNNNQFTSMRDAMTNSEFRNGDRLRDMTALITQNAKDAAICCCDAKVKACENTAQIMAAVAESKSQTLAAIATQGNEIVTRELNAANARVTQLEIMAQCGCNCNS